MAAPQELAYTATSTAYTSTTAYPIITNSEQISGALGSVPDEAQTARFFAWADQSSGSATVRVNFVSKSTGDIIWSDDLSLTVGTLQRTSDSYYLCSGTFASSGTNKLDLMPWRTSKDDISIRVGLAAASTVTAVKVYVGWDRDA